MNEKSYEKLTAIVIAKNESLSIARCLQSLMCFVDEVIVVDSGSTDNTVSIAQSFERVRVIASPWLGFSENKRIGVRHARNNWIFWIDADEEVSPELAQEWLNRSACHLLAGVGGISLPRKTFFLGHWVRHSGWYPSVLIRFFNKNYADFNDNILHEGVIVQQGRQVEAFHGHLLHYSYTSLYQYFDKMNRYGFMGAQEIMRKKKRVFVMQLFFQPAWTFFKFFFLKKGFLDGRIGLIVCMGAAFSNFIKYANLLFYKKYHFVDTSEKTFNKT